MASICALDLPTSEFDTSILSTGDPNTIYQNLIEIGHGNFGAVYSATEKGSNIRVAIKQISYDGKNSREKLQDIQKELQVLRSIHHENCIGFKNVFMRNSHVWIVMEFCVGSIYDIMEVKNSGLREEEISYILYYCLLALQYLHQLTYIHRDIKAANILITESAVVKLADFGSVSLKSPANTFVGSPYWMAPEVILAMEDGLYDIKSDIWSIGIMSYELGERKPPHYHLNTMSAMYHIAQSDPPSLSDNKWSDEYKNLTNSMLKKNPEERPSAMEALDFPFVKKKQDSSIIVNLLVECAEIAKKIDSTNYDKLKKKIDECFDCQAGLVSDSGETDSESHSSLNPINENSKDSPIIFSDINSQNVERLIKTKIEPKLHTIRTAATVNREMQDHQDANYIQMKDYQNLRKANMKQLHAFELKLSSEIQDHKKIHQKCIEVLRINNEKILKGMREKQKADLDKLAKQEVNEENKLKKQYCVSNELRTKTNSIRIKSYLDKTRRHSKRRSGVFSFVQSKNQDDTNCLTSSTESLATKNFLASPELQAIHKIFVEKRKELKIRYLNQEYDFLIQSREQLGKIELDEAKKVAQMQISRLDQIFKLKKAHLEKLHASEYQNQFEYMKKKETELYKKQLSELRSKPKELKTLENSIKKVYMNSIKTQELQYRCLLDQSLQSSSKDLHTSIKERLKSEKIQKIINLQTTMENHIATVVKNEKCRLSEGQDREKEELTTQLELELKSLKNFQTSQLQQLARAKGKELDRLQSDLDLVYEAVEEQYEKELKGLKEQHSLLLEQLKSDQGQQTSFVQSPSKLTSSLDKLENLELPDISEASSAESFVFDSQPNIIDESDP